MYGQEHKRNGSMELMTIREGWLEYKGLHVLRISVKTGEVGNASPLVMPLMDHVREQGIRDIDQ